RRDGLDELDDQLAELAERRGARAEERAQGEADRHADRDLQGQRQAAHGEGILSCCRILPDSAYAARMASKPDVYIGTDSGATMSKVGGVWADGRTISTRLSQRPTNF